MKTMFKNITVIVMCMAALGCSKDNPVEIKPDPVQEQPGPEEPTLVATLNSISPENGPKTTIVTISGSNFGTDPNKVQVFFNDKEAVVLDLKDDEIKTEVPVQAYTGLVKVIVGGAELEGPVFTYVITDILVSTLAGSTAGSQNGAGAEARFDRPSGMVVDDLGNIFIADTFNDRIRKISPAGTVSTFAGSTPGSADGIGTEAQFRQPYDIAIDTDGNIYVADTRNHRIRKISASGLVTTLAGSEQGNDDGPGIDAKFALPRGIAVDTQGIVYVVDTNNHKIRTINLDGEVSTLAGNGFGYADGPALQAKFKFPRGIAIDAGGGLFITDTDSHVIRRLSSDGMVTTFAGEGHAFFSDGQGIEAGFNFPDRLIIDEEDNLYVADTRNERIRKITPDASVTTMAGSVTGSENGTGSEARFNLPSGIAVNDDGTTIYVSDTNNHRIRMIVQD